MPKELLIWRVTSKWSKIGSYIVDQIQLLLVVYEGALHGIHADLLKVLQGKAVVGGCDLHLPGERGVAHEPVVRAQEYPEMIAEKNRERMGSEGRSRPGTDIAGKAHLQGNPLVLDVVSQIPHALDPDSVKAHVVHKPRAMPYPVGPAHLDGLPDRVQSERFSCMDGYVEILVVDEPEGLDMFLGRVALLVSGKIEAHHPAVAVGDGELCDLEAQVRALVAHRAQKQTELHPGFPAPLLKAVEDRTDHTVHRKAQIRMQYRCKADFSIYYVFLMPVQDRLVGHPLQGLLRLHDRRGHGKGFQIKRKTLELAALLEPQGKFRGIGGRN